jgi:hypothetical protein
MRVLLPTVTRPMKKKSMAKDEKEIEIETHLSSQHERRLIKCAITSCTDLGVWLPPARSNSWTDLC